MDSHPSWRQTYPSSSGYLRTVKSFPASVRSLPWNRVGCIRSEHDRRGGCPRLGAPSPGRPIEWTPLPCTDPADAKPSSPDPPGSLELAVQTHPLAPSSTGKATEGSGIGARKTGSPLLALLALFVHRRTDCREPSPWPSLPHTVGAVALLPRPGKVPGPLLRREPWPMQTPSQWIASLRGFRRSQRGDALKAHYGTPRPRCRRSPWHP